MKNHMFSLMGRKNSLLLGLMVVLGVSVQAEAWADSVIYSQPLDTTRNIFLVSQNANPIAYDDFSFMNEAMVTDVHWVGVYNRIGTSPSVTGFTVTFWSDNGGKPGSSLLAQSFSGNANETPDSFQPTQTPFYFDYSINLPVAFSASAGTKYWLSIVADYSFPEIIPPALWAWAPGSGGDSLSYQGSIFQGSTVLTPFSFDLAFELTGNATAVPEPTTMLLLGSGLIGLVGYGRKMFFKN